MGFIERARGDYAAAREHLERAARLKPNDAGTALLLGEVYLLTHELERAAASYQRALRLDPSSTAAQIGLGWSALLAGNTGEAARWWRPVVTRTRDVATLRRMVDLFGAMGDATAAEQARAALAGMGRGAPAGGGG